MAEMQRLSTGEDNFGFVARDSKILQKALTGRSDNAAGSEGGDVRPETTTSGAEHHEAGDGTSPVSIEPSADAAQRPTEESPVATETGDADRVKPRASSSTKRPSKARMSGKPREEAEDEAVSLPQSFQVKYLGQRDASGLWGIKHTRKPVDQMVTAARGMEAGTVLPIVRLVVSREGVSVFPLGRGQEALRSHAIDTISYGVQDLVYTRVFCIIVVREGGGAGGRHPFECHAFVCDSRHGARKLTYALSAAFKEFSRTVKQAGAGGGAAVKKKFAIDLRSPEEIEADLRAPEDSEA